MNRCPITYEKVKKEFAYSQIGLKQLSRNLKGLNDFPYTPKELIRLAVKLATKLSIQGIQPKLSVKLNISKQIFEVVEKGGTYIIKPPHPHFEELPENEDLTMKCAALIGIEVPFHGLIYNKDHSLSYFIKRFDRFSRNQKMAVEDFSELLGFARETKYAASMEKVAFVIEKYCTFPVLEKRKLFRLVIFNFLVGNEDMHLKNFSLIRRGNKVELSPSYDLVNSTIVLSEKEEMALPIKGKKSKLNRSLLIDYYGQERLGLTKAILNEEMSQFEQIIEPWNELIDISFLSPSSKTSYKKLLRHRWNRLLSR